MSNRDIKNYIGKQFVEWLNTHIKHLTTIDARLIKAKVDNYWIVSLPNVFASVVIIYLEPIKKVHPESTRC